MKEYTITVVGMGYVGMSLAVLLSRTHCIYAVDTNINKVEMIKRGDSPIIDDGIYDYMHNCKLNIIATSEPEEAYIKSDFVIIAAPTNYDPSTNSFDTRIVEQIISDITRVNRSISIIIKSTIPVGFTQKMQDKYKNNTILFSPEFLRESKALFDNLHPSRIIVGLNKDNEKQLSIAREFADLLCDSSLEENVPKLLIGSSEAEAIKLFSNTYLAMRVAYFNELDTYAEFYGLDSKEIIEGVCLDPRIGNHYNNPSFGYGGYCLPKDTKQLLANYDNVPETLIQAIVESNQTRKKFIFSRVLCLVNESKNNNKKVVIGVYRLIMKSESDNFRNSAVLDIVEMLKDYGIEVIIFEPALPAGSTIKNCITTNNIDVLKNESTIILANRYDPCLSDVKQLVYTRDIFGRD